MTILMDRLFIKIGFDDEELQNSSYRGYLYVGMIFMLGLTVAFLIMTLLS